MTRSVRFSTVLRVLPGLILPAMLCVGGCVSPQMDRGHVMEPVLPPPQPSEFADSWFGWQGNAVVAASLHLRGDGTGVLRTGAIAADSPVIEVQLRWRHSSEDPYVATLMEAEGGLPVGALSTSSGSNRAALKLNHVEGFIGSMSITVTRAELFEQFRFEGAE